VTSISDPEGPFEGFDPALRLLGTLPVEMRPSEARAMNLNERGGIMVTPDGKVWWTP